MENLIHINYLAVLVALVANVIFGFLWYGPILGKAWMKEMKIPADFKPDSKIMMRSFFFMIIGSFLVLYVLSHNMAAWAYLFVNGMPGQEYNALMMGFSAGFFTWLGFFLPQNLGQVAWENHSWKLFSINAIYNFISLQISAQVISHWRM